MISSRDKTKYACIVEADESMRNRMEGASRGYHGDRMTGKGMNSLSPYNLSSAQIYSNASSNENTSSKGSSGQGMVNSRENTSMAADESQKQERADR